MNIRSTLLFCSVVGAALAQRTSFSVLNTPQRQEKESTRSGYIAGVVVLAVVLVLLVVLAIVIGISNARTEPKPLINEKMDDVDDAFSSDEEEEGETIDCTYEGVAYTRNPKGEVFDDYAYLTIEGILQ